MILLNCLFLQNQLKLSITFMLLTYSAVKMRERGTVALNLIKYIDWHFRSHNSKFPSLNLEFKPILPCISFFSHFLYLLFSSSNYDYDWILKLLLGINLQQTKQKIILYLCIFYEYMFNCINVFMNLSIYL